MLDKIKAEIQKVIDAEGDSENARAQALALFWVLELLDKYAEQEPKTGRWEFVCQHWRKCSECGFSHKFAEDWNYCSNCRAKMVEPQERSDKN